MIRLGVSMDWLEVGGLELSTLDLVSRLDAGRFEPHVYSFRPGELIERLNADGVPTRVGYDKPALDPGWTESDDIARLRYLDMLSDQLREDRIDVLLVSGWFDGVKAGVLAQVPAIVERVDGPSLSGRVRDKSACARVICESESVMRILQAQLDLLRCRPEALTLLAKGVDVQRFDPARHSRIASREALGLSPDDIAIGTVCRLAPEKNIGQLVAAFARLGATHPIAKDKLRLVICGPDYGELASLQSRAYELGVAERTQFIGAREDVGPVLAALDVFALTSLYEGTPGALLEAMAMGLPVVATTVGAVPEVVDGNGFLVPPLDPYATARALGELAADSELRERLGRRSRELALRRDMRSTAAQFQKMLETVYDESRTNAVAT